MQGDGGNSQFECHWERVGSGCCAVPRRGLASFRDRWACGTRSHRLRDPRAVGFWSRDPHSLSTACSELARVVVHATRYDRFRHVDGSASGNLSNPGCAGPRTSRLDAFALPRESWKPQGRGLSGSANWLALALVLTTGLLVRSYAKLYYADTGFDARGLATVSVLLGPEYRGQFEKQLSRDRQLLQRLGSLPGADEAASTTWLPLTDSAHWWRVSFADRALSSHPEVRAGQSAVSPGYFKVMRTPLIEGREFSGADTMDSTPVVIVNQTMARRYYPSESPVGRRIRLGEEGMPWMTIVGVVASTRHLALDTAPGSETYVPFTQYRYLQLTHFVLRSHGNPRALLPEIVPAIHSVDKTLPALLAGTMPAGSPRRSGPVSLRRSWWPPLEHWRSCSPLSVSTEFLPKRHVAAT